MLRLPASPDDSPIIGGRSDGSLLQVIDPEEWDANRVSLMTELYRCQVAVHQDMADTLYEWRSKTIKEDATPDPFWQKTMPAIWKMIGRELAANDGEIGDDGGGDDEDDEADALSTKMTKQMP